LGHDRDEWSDVHHLLPNAVDCLNNYGFTFLYDSAAIDRERGSEATRSEFLAHSTVVDRQGHRARIDEGAKCR
jgi:hypothetical protein